MSSEIHEDAGSNEEKKYNEATETLLVWLSTTIARDGGGSLVTSLNDHYWPFSTKRLNTLLVNSSVGKPKLLRFLEHFPDLFQVDRQAIPHWVVLLQKYQIEDHAYTKLMNELTEVDPCELRKTQDALFQKVQYILRRRNSRLKRRALQQKSNHHQAYKVNLFWLVRQCPWEIHFYLRASDFYQRYYGNFNDESRHSTVSPVAPVMSKEWQSIVWKPLRDMLVEDFASEFADDGIDTGKIWLREQQQAMEELLTAGKESDILEQSKATEQKIPSLSEKTLNDMPESNDWLERLEQTLHEIVKKDGATQVSLGLLLHRHQSLKVLLGGRDLESLLQTYYPSRFTHIKFWKVDHDLVLQHIDYPAALRDHDSDPQQQRMKVDRVGLFSVTNSKWSKAIANTLVHLCKTKTRLGDSASRTAIDLTASVGGMTLGLAKHDFFTRVVALEIDPTRARFCEENMAHHDVSHKVEVRTVDSIKAIPTLPNESCLVIDPPWGGENYKKFKGNPHLSQMLSKKLPPTFQIVLLA